MPSSSTTVLSTVILTTLTFLLQFAVVSHTLLKCNVQLSNLMCYEICLLYIQVYNFLNPTQLLSALTYSSKEYSLFQNFSWIVFSLFLFCLDTHLWKHKEKPLIYVFVHHMMSNGCSLKEYPQNFNKGMQDLGKS